VHQDHPPPHGLRPEGGQDLVEETMGRNGYDEISEKSIEIPPNASSSLINLLDEHTGDLAPSINPGHLRALGASVIKIERGSQDMEADAINYLRQALSTACNAQNDGLTMDILLLIQKYTT